MSKLDGSATDVVMLLKLACAAGPGGVGSVCQTVWPKNRAWCRTWRLQEADAQDVTQAVLVKLVVRLRRFTYDPSLSFRGWLRTSVNHVCSDCRAGRRRSLGEEFLVRSDGFDLIQTAAVREDLGRRLAAEFDLELLDEAQRRVRRRVAPHTWEAYRLTALEGVSAAEAAARLGVKVAAVFVSRSRVTKQLQHEVKALENQPGAVQPP